ncbi:MAG: maleylacetoacetate isomerase [Pseudomonadota bacterium]
MSLVLHNYFRSSTSFRVRAALNLKGLAYDYVAYPLREGAQRSPAYLALNPEGLVPTLVTEEGPLAQSLAIVEWLDETHPEPPLLPADAWGRARVRALADAIALDIHPLNNLRVLQALGSRFGADEAARADWFRHWVAEGFAALEARLAGDAATGTFCHGEAPGLADLCLAAQCLNNRRFAVEMDPYPTIARIHAACMALPAFAEAAPENQPDAE